MMGILFLIKFLIMPSEKPSVGSSVQKIRLKKTRRARKNLRNVLFQAVCVCLRSNIF
ncbi:hypothetical protein NEICINOT_04271 [Neisseria cinerea ATCC 14685]|uniref:Uncharacterized protein n=1 Tax=Neisseria cinerea ATCC 14685 TaxID=546262 RepID=D0W3M9_NEICI|nr:hypothetical protein NEICINOT_04271 [Neisseria cinerea ATCC 14685]